MTRPCSIGIQLPEVERFVAWPELIAMAKRAEAVGFDEGSELGMGAIGETIADAIRGFWADFHEETRTSKTRLRRPDQPRVSAKEVFRSVRRGPQ